MKDFISANVSEAGGSSSMEWKAPVDSVGDSKEQYQIFLSFRVEDTRHNFADNVYHALRQEGFKIFMDQENELERRDSLSQVNIDAIENSKLSIIIFSETFANSARCLDEVVQIFECKEKKNQLVWLVFYKVEPSDVMYQRNSYEKAMIRQENKFGKYSEKVIKWKSTLSQVCDLKTFHYKDNSGYERAFIQEIVKDVNNIIRDQL